MIIPWRQNNIQHCWLFFHTLSISEGFFVLLSRLNPKTTLVSSGFEFEWSAVVGGSLLGWLVGWLVISLLTDANCIRKHWQPCNPSSPPPPPPQSRRSECCSCINTVPLGCNDTESRGHRFNCKSTLPPSSVSVNIRPLPNSGITSDGRCIARTRFFVVRGD